jgi:hypothetical protein
VGEAGGGEAGGGGGLAFADLDEEPAAGAQVGGGRGEEATDEIALTEGLTLD